MDTKITLEFRESEMKHIEAMLMKYYGGKKFKTKRDRKRWLGIFISTMFSKGMYAVEEDKEYMEVA
jgi:hypothetical protein